MYYDNWMPPRFSGRDVAAAWILAALLFLGLVISISSSVFFAPVALARLEFPVVGG